MDDGVTLGKFVGHTQEIQAMAISQDDTFLVSGEYSRISFNTLRPKQNGRHFTGGISKCIS